MHGKFSEKKVSLKLSRELNYNRKISIASNGRLLRYRILITMIFV